MGSPFEASLTANGRSGSHGGDAGEGGGGDGGGGDGGGEGEGGTDKTMGPMANSRF